MTAGVTDTGRAPVGHRPAADSAARGKAARQATPRSAHAEFDPVDGRSDPIAILEAQCQTRVPELVPIRYGRMLASPFAFYRGAAAIMAEDLASTPRSGFTVQCCGDAHLSNFGVFASPDRRLVFDVNDFDETLPGPWEWDVKRLAASMLIAAQSNAFPRGDQHNAVLGCVASYRTAMAQFASAGDLDVWYSRFEIEGLLDQYAAQFRPKAVKRTERALARARTRDSMSAFAKLTEVVDGQVRIVDHSPLIVPIARLAQGAEHDQIMTYMRRLFAAYRESLPPDRRPLLDRFALVDLARKVVGVGSVGTQSWIALLRGPVGDEPLFLQIKQAQPSVLERYVGGSAFGNHGQRVVIGQRMMQAGSDIFLGWLRVDPGTEQECDYYGRQLKDWKGSAEIEQMDPAGLATYGRMCGWTLARAHARSGDRVAIAAYLGRGDNFDRALLEFSERYAERNARDYQALVDAVESGRVTAHVGV